MLHDSGEAHPGQPHEASPELGVEQAGRAHADLRQAGQVLGGGMQDPLDIREDGADGGEIGARDRVDQPGARTLAPDLDEIGPLPVAVAGCALGVQGHRAGAGGQGRGGTGEVPLGDDHVRDTLRGHGQGHQDPGICFVVLFVISPVGAGHV